MRDVDPSPRLAELVGTVASVKWQGYSSGFVLRCDAMTLPEGQESPRRVLVTCRQQLPGIAVGDAVRLRGLFRLDARGCVMDAVELERLAPRDASARGWAWSSLDRLQSRRQLGQSLLLGQGDAPESADFRRAGLLHVLAVSGMHLAIAAVLGLWLLRVAGVGWGTRQVALAALIIGYTWLTGASPATMRALVMGLCVVAMALLAREPHRLAAVSLSAFALMVIDPTNAGNIGFQLSLAAVLGILTMGLDLVRLRTQVLPLAPWPLDRPTWRAALWSSRALCDGLAIGIAASVATLPLIAWHFHTATPWSPITTLAATPPTTVALWLGLPCVALAGAFPNGPWEGLYAALEWNLEALAAIVRWAASWPGASMAVSAPGPATLLLWPLLFLPLRDRIDIALRTGAFLVLIALWAL
ncbi:MAG: ComEC/Rec2 family competence protein [Planctomycetes bacterium]|nr:ComEC/Rec2 family competence protein [Planctomycetota bacterium]